MPALSLGARLAPVAFAAALVLAASPLRAAPDASGSRYYEDALTRFEKRDHAGAIIQLKNALQIDRTQLPVQVLLGRALLADAQPAAAEVALLEALRLGVNRAEIAVPLAQALIAQGQQGRIFEQVALKPDGLPAGARFSLLLLRGSASADMGDARGALEAITAARALDPQSPESWLAEVPVRIRAHAMKEAADAAQRGLDLSPRNADAWYQKGSVAHVRGDTAGALASYERAIALKPEEIEPRVTRAGLLLDLKRNADAGAELAALHRLSPREPRAAYLRGVLAERESRGDDAKLAMREVTALLDPVPLEFIRYRPQLLLLNGLAHFSLDEREKAMPYLESFQKAYGQGAASKLLAQIHLSQKNPAKAVESLEPYLRARPDDSQAMAMLASAEMARGNGAKATSLMTEAVRANDAPELRSMLGLSLIGGGRLVDGRSQLEAAFAKDPSQLQAAAALVGIYLQAGESARARTVADTLVRQRPDDAALVNLQGVTRVRAGDAVGARTAFERASTLDPNLIAAKINLARLESAAGQHDAAAQRLGDILKTQERQPDALLEMGVLASRRGQPEEALRWLQRAFDLAGPHDVKPGLALVDFQLQRGQTGAANEAAKRLLSKAPQDLNVLFAVARAQLAGGDTVAARATLSTAAAWAGFDARTQVQVAVLQQRADNLDGAVYSVDKALSNDPGYLPALAMATDLAIRQRAFAKAEPLARQVVRDHPRLSIGHSLLGDLALAQGKRAQAVDAFRTAHLLEPTSESLLRLFAAAMPLDGGRPALQIGEQWVRAHPADLRVRKAVADALAANGQLVPARAAYEAALKLKPDDGEVLNNLANVLLRSNDAGALRLAERAAAASPGKPAVLDTLGWAAFQAGQLDRALQVLRDARLRDPASPDIRYHLAAVLAQAGRAAEARDELGNALRGGRRFESVAEAEALSRTLK